MDMTLKNLVYMRDTVLQRGRLQFGNRLKAIERGDSKVTDAEKRVIEYWYTRLAEMENDATEQIEDQAKDYEIIQHAAHVKGIGLVNVAKVVAHIDIERAGTVSALWRYAGFAVIDGERERLKKGEKAHFNRTLKTACFLIGSSLLKANSPYRKVYDDAKEYYQNNREWTKAHIHVASMRKMIKVFLSHLWLRWRELEGLPTGNPYIIGRTDEKGGQHTRVITPEEMGWPALTNE